MSDGVIEGGRRSRSLPNSSSGATGCLCMLALTRDQSTCTRRCELRLLRNVRKHSELVVRYNGYRSPSQTSPAAAGKDLIDIAEDEPHGEPAAVDMPSSIRTTLRFDAAAESEEVDQQELADAVQSSPTETPAHVDSDPRAWLISFAEEEEGFIQNRTRARDAIPNKMEEEGEEENFIGKTEIEEEEGGLFSSSEGEGHVKNCWGLTQSQHRQNGHLSRDHAGVTVGRSGRARKVPQRFSQDLELLHQSYFHKSSKDPREAGQPS